MLRTIALLILWSLVFGGSGASGCRGKQKTAPQPQRPVIKIPASGELKVLAEGFHSPINDPFIAVVRDAETYAALLKRDGNLPKLDKEFFDLNTVVAAFLGERNTGGYSVEITRATNGDIRVAEKVPGKGVMVPQMITAPFKIVAVPQSAVAPISLSADDAWSRNIKHYRVTSGRFTMSGGFAGTSETFTIEGWVRVWRERDLATFGFEVISVGLERPRSLSEYATGIVQSDGHITVNKMSSGSLVSPPNSGLKTTGTFFDSDNKLSLSLVSLPLMIADGYSGTGSIEAEASAPAPKP